MTTLLRQGDDVRLTTNTEQVRAYDVPGESRGWHTALYYFAEHMRSLSHGRVNHKVLYSYLGTNGHYINHDNPTIRKRTAAMLSRLIHSQRYVADFQTSYERDREVFDAAARKLSEGLCADAQCDPEEAVACFCGSLWQDVERGLEHEREDGRVELNLDRIASEMSALFAWCVAQVEKDARERLALLASAYFHLLTFGHLDERFVYELADETPLDAPRPCGDDVPMDCREDRACLIKYSSAQEGAIANWWTVDADRPFAIGRYTDSAVIEENPYVSRTHCRIVARDGRWFLEDRNSTHGSRVLRGDELVYDSARDGNEPFELAFGDHIVLAGASSYWFGALLENRRSSRR